MQSLPKRTNTDLSLLDFRNIEFEIDYRKLICFRQLCCLPPVYTAKDIFLYTLINFNGQISSQRGFIPDIHRILGKYSLMQVFHTVIENDTFISKGSWKRLVWEKKIVSCVRPNGLRGFSPLPRLIDYLTFMVKTKTISCGIFVNNSHNIYH